MTLPTMPSFHSQPRVFGPASPSEEKGDNGQFFPFRMCGLFSILHLLGKKETGRKGTHVLAVVISGYRHRSDCFSF